MVSGPMRNLYIIDMANLAQTKDRSSDTPGARAFEKVYSQLRTSDWGSEEADAEEGGDVSLGESGDCSDNGDSADPDIAVDTYAIVENSGNLMKAQKLTLQPKQ